MLSQLRIFTFADDATLDLLEGDALAVGPAQSRGGAVAEALPALDAGAALRRRGRGRGQRRGGRRARGPRSPFRPTAAH